MIAGRSDPKAEVQVLLLENTECEAQRVQAALRKSGICAVIRRALDREQYLEALDARRPDVVLANSSTPAFRGTEALELARDRYPDLPFIFLSGSKGESLAVEG